MKYLLFAAAAFAIAAPASAATFNDDFNRPDGLGLGSDYTTHNGGFAISGDRAITNGIVSLATVNGSNATSATIDVALRGADAGSYVALSFGYDPADEDDSYFVKVQDNNGDGFFDVYGFYVGNNNNTDGLFSSLNPFQSGTFTASYSGTTATLSVVSGSTTQTFSFDYGFALTDGTVGFGLNRQGVADNVTTELGAQGAVPEPGTWALMIAGFGGAGAALRRSRRRVVSAHA
jgi:hypothetical protein